MNFKNIKSNQIILFVVALMLVSAGYLSYSMRGTPVSSNIVSENEVSSIGDARLVSSNNVIDSNSLNEVSVATSSSSSSRTDDYFASSRLGRDTMYSQMIESYQNLLDNQNVSEEQKTVATQEITEINNTQNSIMICENLIKTKGISDVVIFVNDKSINVIVKADTLEQDTIAQIQNIIAREMNAEIENIHISNK
ncbi:MAG: SpoIIIAH-like family protein [Clostridia bacterium]|jgi:stage III sporulation protein AH|uniref:SpoIIIAH-like family protein n=1 Tax=Candidatus Merdicola sp. TaxID=3085652 RepID=UPI003A2DEA35